ncbi:MAG: hypothetical protein AVDCRST_MAG62-268, partial [uncultured Sphingomonas sp.]
MNDNTMFVFGPTSGEKAVSLPMYSKDSIGMIKTLLLGTTAIRTFTAAGLMLGSASAA